MRQVFAAQRQAFDRDRNPSLKERRDRLERAITLVVDHEEAWCDAIAADFSGRPREQTRLADLVPALDTLRYTRRHLRAWMRPERRSANFPLNWLGARASIQFQPKGVVA